MKSQSAPVAGKSSDVYVFSVQFLAPLVSLSTFYKLLAYIAFPLER